jgi:GntR family transcriptional regulator
MTATPGSQMSTGSPVATWQILKEYVEEQIATDVYPVGAWLPSVRQLGGQLGVNRNTVSKVYQALGRDGVLEVTRGKGVRVMAKPAAGRTAADRINGAITALVREASLGGIARDRLLAHFVAAADAVYGHRQVRMAFVECTMPDARQLAVDLGRHLSVSVTPIDLADLAAAPAMAADFDLVTTTFFHLQEVTAMLAGIVEPVGIHHAVSHQSVLEIARLRPGSTIVIVCPNERTLERIRSIVETYAQGRIYGFTIDEEAKVRQALSLADVAVDISLTHDAVASLAPDLSTITVSFHIEQQSIEYLRDVVQHLAREAGRRHARPSEGDNESDARSSRRTTRRGRAARSTGAAGSPRPADSAPARGGSSVDE